MATYLIPVTFSAAIGNTSAQSYRPGDTVDDTDANFAAIQAATPTPGLQNVAGLGTLPADALSMRSKAVPDDVVQNYILEQLVSIDE